MTYAMKGSYVLLIQLPEEQRITIGTRPAVHFPGGYYAYVGSAMGGFKSRLERHLNGNKIPHWHIDYLRQRASINNIVLCETESKLECAIAQSLSHHFDSIPGFGSSDCKCRSHLFFAPDGAQLKSKVMANISRLGIKPSLINGKDSVGEQKGTG